MNITIISIITAITVIGIKTLGFPAIKNILKNNIVYLWVYKKNTKAIKLYKKLGFNIIEETDTRYYMKYKRSTYERIY